MFHKNMPKEVLDLIFSFGKNQTLCVETFSFVPNRWDKSKYIESFFSLEKDLSIKIYHQFETSVYFARSIEDFEMLLLERDQLTFDSMNFTLSNPELGCEIVRLESFYICLYRFIQKLRSQNFSPIINGDLKSKLKQAVLKAEEKIEGENVLDFLV